MFNNFFLFSNEQNKFDFLPYDMDSILEYDFINGEYSDWADVNVFRWGNFSKRSNRPIPYAPLCFRILKVREFRDMYIRHLRNILSIIFKPNGILFDRISSLKEYLTPFIVADSNFIMNDPIQSLSSFLITSENILQYVARRYHTAVKQIAIFKE